MYEKRFFIGRKYLIRTRGWTKKYKQRL